MLTVLSAHRASPHQQHFERREIEKLLEDGLIDISEKPRLVNQKLSRNLMAPFRIELIVCP